MQEKLPGKERIKERQNVGKRAEPRSRSCSISVATIRIADSFMIVDYSVVGLLVPLVSCVPVMVGCCKRRSVVKGEVLLFVMIRERQKGFLVFVS
eukprot:scaffold18583_cov160-Amphora_coffeaeformis.AAC.5